MEARLGAVPGRDGTTQGWDNSLATASPAQHPGQVSDERVTNALRMMQDPLQQTTVISQRRSQKMLSEQSTSKTKGNAAHEAMEAAARARERQAETRRLFEQKCQEAAERGDA